MEVADLVDFTSGGGPLLQGAGALLTMCIGLMMIGSRLPKMARNSELTQPDYEHMKLAVLWLILAALLWP